jgi:hypothetical protein
MRDTPRLVAILCLVAPAAACGSDPFFDPGPLFPEQGIDAGLCFLDCFAGASCVGGVLHAAPAGPNATFPCNEPPPFECPVVTRTCELGCVLDGAFVGGDSRVDNTSVYDWLCRTAPTAVAGQACTTDADCRPTFAAPAGELGVEMVYLGCGAENVCVEVAAPELAGWGAPCDADGNNTDVDVLWGENTVAGGLPACLEGASCTFATITCVGDWECPAGARCDRAVGRLDGGPSAFGVCRPGSWPLRDQHLGCW